MKLELDHFFILTDPESKAGDLLLSLGMEESFSRDHDGQGTSNRRFVFSNSMLELLWVRDVNEVRNGPAKNLKFDERTNASPFGLVFTRTEGKSNEMPFDGWEYQPKYFEPPMAFHVGSNSENIQEPLCIYAPFVKPVKRTIEKGTFKSISSVRVFVPVEHLSETLLNLTRAKGIQLQCGEKHLMEITFDDNSGEFMRDLRPDLPIILYW